MTRHETAALARGAALLALLVAGLPACDRTSDDSFVVAPLVTADPAEIDFGPVVAGGQARASLTLKNRSGSSLTVAAARVEGTGVVSVVSPRAPVTLPAGEEMRLELAFAPDSVGSLRGQLQVAGLQVPITGQATSHELRPRDTLIDPGGERHTVFDAYRRGIRVLGAEVIRHGSSDVQLREDVRFDDTPAVISLAAAEATARDSVAEENARIVAVLPELVYEEKDGVHRLVYRVDVYLHQADTARTRWRMRIDARTGGLLSRRDLTPHTDSTGRSFFRGTVPLKTFFYQDGAHPLGQGFTLEDHLRPRIGEVLETRSRYNAAGVETEYGVPFFDPDGTFGNGQKFKHSMMPAVSPFSDIGQTDGVDAHNAAAWAWDVYTDIFGRQGPYGDGSGLKLIVHDPGASAYHQFDRTITLTIGTDVRSPNTDLAVLGHEMGHAFTYSMFDDDYIGEPGGINEATSDILGKLTEIYAAVGKGQPLPQSWSDWNCYAGGHVLRRMDDPASDGESWNQWWPEMEDLDPHNASGPINRMFYFLAQGVAATGQPGQKSAFLRRGLAGIGIPEAASVYFRAVTTELTPRVNPKFADLRAAMERAAPNSRVKQAVQDAFAAVNVGEMADRDPPTFVLPTKIASGFVLSANASDPSGLKSVRYTLLDSLEKGATRTLLGTALSPPWSITPTLPPIPVAPPKGTVPPLYLEVCATDVLDNGDCQTGPVTRVTGPTINTFITADPHLPVRTRVVSIDASAPGGLSAIEVSFTDRPDRPAWLLWSKQLAPSPRTTQYAGSPSITLPLNVPHGMHELRLTVSDQNGFHTTRVIELPWDLEPPNVCEFASTDSFRPPSGVVAGRAGDALTGLAQVAYYLDSTLLGSFAVGSAPGSSTLTPQASYSTTVGPHTFTMVCVDRAGRTRSVSQAVTMNAPPAATVTILGQGGSGAFSTVTASFTFSDTDVLREVSGALNCTVTGHHPLNLGMVGTPTSFSTALTTYGLSSGETCELAGLASDVLRLSSAARKTFVVTGAPLQPPPSGGTVACNSTVQSGSADATYTVTLDAASGATTLRYNTLTAPDNLIITCADGGTVNGSRSAQTGCGEYGTIVEYSWRLNYQCNSRRLKVQVDADCRNWGNTEWEFSLSCR